MSTAFPVTGNVPAVVTPFDETGEIVFSHFERILRWHLERGVDGLCIAGDNGESWTLSLAERAKLAETAVRVAAGRVPVVMGASASTARQTIAYAEAVADKGVAALMIGPQPYVMKATTSELVTRFETVHRAVPLPILLYNSPRRTGISLTIDSMRALTDAVPIVALKEASRDFFYVTHVIREFRERLAVLIGPAPFIIPGLQLGAAGFISSGPEFFAAETSEVMAASGKAISEEMRALHYRYTVIYETLMALGTWPSSLKATHNLLGLPAGVPREPVAPLAGDDLRKLTRVLREIGVLESVPASVATA